MKTYIVRIHRYEEEGKEPAAVGIVEDAETGKTSKFAGPEELLKILKLQKTRAGGQRKARQDKT